ncbi:E3 ubiquitin-protein ligase BRE1-like 1 [Phalaenopsis equestris]|uniref:E3 ubiquitin-protein ligase BRE1-like 1 n=1 Tax=Phalaenopsis equestris TaxID=78828 RepID=UPI0009E25462|nr:E3 ubiquitin-protein ligase BRE1-like 1 [Phalaenopsis equestris]
MGSTGEPDRKRRHFSSISPTAGAAAKKHLLSPCTDDKKLDVAVLQFQNQKLFQQLEAQKVEYFVLDDKYNMLKKQHQIYEDSIVVVNKSWEQLVNDLELHSICTSESASSKHYLQDSCMLEDGASFPIQDDFLSRLLEADPTESCSYNVFEDPQDCAQMASEMTKSILQNIISSINWMWHLIDDVASALQATVLENDPGLQLPKSVDALRIETKNLIMAVNDLHWKHRHLASQIQNNRNVDAKFKAEKKRLEGALASTVLELKDSNSKLANLKAQGDGSKGAPIIFPILGNKVASGDTARDTNKEMHDMESLHKELQDLVSSKMGEIRNLYESRIEMLRKLVNLQNALLDFKSISSSKFFVMLKEQLDKSTAEMDNARISLEKLQVERENFIWHEREVTMKSDLADVTGKISELSELRIAELEQESQNNIKAQNLLEAKLEEALREPGRKNIIAEFKELVSSFSKEMGTMQNELSNSKVSTSEIHRLRAQKQSLSGILGREVRELQSLTDKSVGQLSEIERLHLVVGDLRESEQELKLILEMYRRESTDFRDILESRDQEYKAWAHVQSLNSSLDEHSLEGRVKTAIEAEALSQQRLATAEAEIADLRQKLEFSMRDVTKSSEKLNSKHEEGEAYLSEIESIGQAYEDMQTQNQLLLQQITERDEYNIKLVMEGVKARQMHAEVLSDVKSIEKKLQEGNSLVELYDLKNARFDEQLRVKSDQVAKLVEDGWQSSIALGNAQRKLADVQKESESLRQSMKEIQMQAMNSRSEITELLIELERERFNKKRIDEELETMTIKAAALRQQTDGSVLLEKLHQEIREYKGILKCRICHDRQKEVVIAKCYHLFCSQCVQKTIESRHRKCPTCSVSFGLNDVKPIYI